jgi:hypothetical protein
MFTQDVSIPGLKTTVAVAGANLYAECLAVPEIQALVPAITVATFSQVCSNKPLQAACVAHLSGRKAKVWVKGLYAVAFALQQQAAQESPAQA